MIDLTPEDAKASSLAIRIAQRVLLCDRMISVRVLYAAKGRLWALCASLAREIDRELNAAGKCPSCGSVEEKQSYCLCGQQVGRDED
jgi:hypothetical protein